MSLKSIFSEQILVLYLIGQWNCRVKAGVIPQYTKYDAYMKACNTSGDMRMIQEFDRWADVLNKLRGLDFGVIESWDPSRRPSFKGCEPLKHGKKPVHCNTS